MVSGKHELQAQEVLNRSFDKTDLALRTKPIADSDVKFATISASASGNTEVVAAVTGKKIRVLSCRYTCNEAVNVKFQSATTDITGFGYHGGQGQGLAEGHQQGVFETAEGEALNINLSGAVAVGGRISYVEV